jgi:hypothetical protein
MKKLILLFAVLIIAWRFAPVAIPSYTVISPATTIYQVAFALDSAGVTTVYDTTSVAIFGNNPDTATAFQNRAITEQRNYDATH